MSDRETYLLRASEARQAADSATLENVRERCLRAESAWIQMAKRVERAETMRAELLAEKARQQEAAAAEQG